MEEEATERREPSSSAAAGSSGQLEGEKCADAGPTGRVPCEKANGGGAHADVPGVVVSDSWVCCDDCGKWRRVPHDVADSLDEHTSW